MKRIKAFPSYGFIIALVFSAALLPAIASAQVAGQMAGKLTKVEGRVDILKTGAVAAVPVKVNDQVSIGDIIRTKSDGKAVITFVDKTVMTIGPRSRLGIEEYLYNPRANKRVSSLKLYRGKMGFKVTKPVFAAAGSKFEMKTRAAVAGVRGTSGMLLTGMADRVYVKTGIVEFKTPLGKVLVTAGRVGEAFIGRPPTERPFSPTELNKQEGGLKPSVPSGGNSGGGSKQGGNSGTSGNTSGQGGGTSASSGGTASGSGSAAADAGAGLSTSGIPSSTGSLSTIVNSGTSASSSITQSSGHNTNTLSSTDSTGQTKSSNGSPLSSGSGLAGLTGSTTTTPPPTTTTTPVNINVNFPKP